MADVLPIAVVLASLSGLVAIIDIPPFVWHVKQGNMAPAALVLWIIILNLITVLNAILWPDLQPQNHFSGLGLCDVQVRLLVASWNALPACLAVILRNLARVMDPDNAVPIFSPAQKRRDLAINIAFCIVVPFFFSAIHLIVQERRFYVLPVEGCDVSTDDSWPSIFLSYLPPVILAMGAGYYAAMLVFRLHRYRRQFSDILQTHNTNKSRFNRLWQISLIIIIWVLPQSIYVGVKSATSYPLHDFDFWKLHDAKSWNSAIFLEVLDISFDRYIRIVAGILLFVFFGMGQDATQMYKGWLIKAGFARCFPSLLRPPQHSSRSMGSTASSLASSAWQQTKAAFKLRRSSSLDEETGLATASTGTSTASTKPHSAASDSSTMKSYSLPNWPPSPPAVKQQTPTATVTKAKPYDGLPQSITASASGEPPSSTQSERGSIRVTRAVWQEVEPTRQG